MLYRLAALQVSCPQALTGFAAFAADRADPAVPTVTIDLVDHPPIPNGEPAAQHPTLNVHRADGGWLLTVPGMEKVCAVLVSVDYLHAAVWTDPAASAETARLCQLRLLQTVLECASISQGAFSLHSAAVALDGEAVAFTGYSGIGKSTRAAQWIRALGAELLSGDRPQLTAHADGFRLHGVPWDGKEQCFRSETLPLKAILEVRRADTPRIRKLSTPQKLTVLMRQCFIPMWDTGLAAAQIAALRSMAARLPMVRVFCGPDEAAAIAIRQLLYTQPAMILEEQKDMKAAKDFTLRKVVGEYILMPTGANIGQYDGTVILNEVSAFVWEQLQNPMSRDDLLTAVLDEFDVDPATAAADLDALLDKLRGYGVVVHE